MAPAPVQRGVAGLLWPLAIGGAVLCCACCRRPARRCRSDPDSRRYCSGRNLFRRAHTVERRAAHRRTVRCYDDDSDDDRASASAYSGSNVCASSAACGGGSAYGGDDVCGSSAAGGGGGGCRTSHTGGRLTRHGMA